MKNEKTMYGGQAVIEGVMFGGKHHFVTAIRRKDNSIDFFNCREKNILYYPASKKFLLFAELPPLLKQAQTAPSI